MLCFDGEQNKKTKNNDENLSQVEKKTRALTKHNNNSTVINLLSVCVRVSCPKSWYAKLITCFSLLGVIEFIMILDISHQPNRLIEYYISHRRDSFFIRTMANNLPSHYSFHAIPFSLSPFGVFFIPCDHVLKWIAQKLKLSEKEREKNWLLAHHYKIDDKWKFKDIWMVRARERLQALPRSRLLFFISFFSAFDFNVWFSMRKKRSKKTPAKSSRKLNGPIDWRV